MKIDPATSNITEFTSLIRENIVPEFKTYGQLHRTYNDDGELVTTVTFTIVKPVVEADKP